MLGVGSRTWRNTKSPQQIWMERQRHYGLQMSNTLIYPWRGGVWSTWALSRQADGDPYLPGRGEARWRNRGNLLQFCTLINLAHYSLNAWAPNDHQPLHKNSQYKREKPSELTEWLATEVIKRTEENIKSALISIFNDNQKTIDP